jgi:uncharacterized protein YcfL
MKKLSIIILSVLLFIGCNKESGSLTLHEEEAVSKSGQKSQVTRQQFSSVVMRVAVLVSSLMLI